MVKSWPRFTPPDHAGQGRPIDTPAGDFYRWLLLDFITLPFLIIPELVLFIKFKGWADFTNDNDGKSFTTWYERYNDWHYLFYFAADVFVVYYISVSGEAGPWDVFNEDDNENNDTNVTGIW